METHTVDRFRLFALAAMLMVCGFVASLLLVPPDPVIQFQVGLTVVAMSLLCSYWLVYRRAIFDSP